jgi:hypothetical protein
MAALLARSGGNLPDLAQERLASCLLEHERRPKLDHLVGKRISLDLEGGKKRLLVLFGVVHGAAWSINRD